MSHEHQPYKPDHIENLYLNRQTLSRQLSPDQILNLPHLPIDTDQRGQPIEAYHPLATIESIAELGILHPDTINKLQYLAIKKEGRTYFIPGLPSHQKTEQKAGVLTAEQEYDQAAEHGGYNDAYGVPEMFAGDFLLKLKQNLLYADLRKKFGPKLKRLDIGCGPGEGEDRHSNDPDDTLGVDLSGQSVVLAHLKHPDGKYLKADATELQVVPNSFHVLTAEHGVFNYFSKPQLEQLHATLYDGLAPEGIAWIMPYTNQVKRQEQVGEGQTPGIEVAERRFFPLEDHIKVMLDTGYIIKEVWGYNKNTSTEYNGSLASLQLRIMKRLVRAGIASQEEYNELLNRQTQACIDFMIPSDVQARLQGTPADEFRHMAIVAEKPRNDYIYDEPPKEPVTILSLNNQEEVIFQREEAKVA